MLISCRTKLLSAGTLDIPAIAPCQRGTIELPDARALAATGEIWLTVSFRIKETTQWADSGYEIAWCQHRLGTTASTPKLIKSPTEFDSPLKVHSTKTAYTIHNPMSSFTFSRATGHLTNWTANGYTLIEADPTTNAAGMTLGFWRAPTDNDVSSDALEWRHYGLDIMTSQLRNFALTHNDKDASPGVQLTATSWISPPILAWGFRATITYLISPAGNLRVNVHLRPECPMPADIPRVGLDIRLHDDLDAASWFGRGPGESYVDKKLSQKLGVYSSTVEQLHTSYEVPQENGNRVDTRWVRMGDKRGWGVRASRVSIGGDKNEVAHASQQSNLFQWVASRYSAEALEKAHHPRDLVPERCVRLRLDAESGGVGTGACGPTTLEQYRVKCEEKSFAFELEAWFGDEPL